MNSSIGFGRRTFLAGAAAAAALSAAPVALAAGQRSGVVVAVEQPHSLRFARSLADAGAHSLVARGDLVRFWRDELAPLLAMRPQRISGLSDWSTYLILSGCAAEQGLRVRHEARHDIATDGRYVAGMLAAGAGSDWSMRLAQAFLHDRLPSVHIPQQAPALAGQTTLISWVLA
ncbi:MAG: hypothetical protein RBS88_04150 [Spongiibacteraceae bacterium]|jgi:hypothetical protein|nr:hypothetical protein [Spongiibacteraceae bacterium]